MATKKKTKTPAKKSTKNLSKKLKFNRVQALSIVLVLAVIGAVWVFHSYAAEAPFVTYLPRSAGIAHSTGTFAENFAIRLAGKEMHVNVQDWGTSKPDSKVHFLQYGPYSSVTIPKSATGLHVCYYYAASNDGNRPHQYIDVYTDLNYNVGSSPQNYTVGTQPQRIAEDPWMTDPQDSKGLIYTVRAHCENYGFSSTIRNLTKVEYRLKVTGGSDAYANLDLWKTTVSFY